MIELLDGPEGQNFILFTFLFICSITRVSRRNKHPLRSIIEAGEEFFGKADRKALPCIIVTEASSPEVKQTVPQITNQRLISRSDVACSRKMLVAASPRIRMLRF